MKLTVDQAKKVLKLMCENVDLEGDQTMGCTGMCNSGSYCFLNYESSKAINYLIEKTEIE